jgi:hypothetical protein
MRNSGSRRSPRLASKSSVSAMMPIILRTSIIILRKLHWKRHVDWDYH